MIKLRLRRTGRKKSPSYQIVAVDSRKKRDGSYLEKLGYYHSLSGEHKISAEKALKWLHFGAQPTLVVRSLLHKSKILALFHSQKIARKKSNSAKAQELQK